MSLLERIEKLSAAQPAPEVTPTPEPSTHFSVAKKVLRRRARVEVDYLKILTKQPKLNYLIPLV